MTSAGWISSLVKDQPDLFRAIYDWNVYPHRWVLPERLEPVAGVTAAIAVLERTAAGRARLSRHFRTRLGLQDTWWDFQEPRRRLALLSAGALERLARFAGAARHAAQLARVITKAERRTLTEQIGEAGYAFALRRGRTLGLDEAAPNEATGEAGLANEITRSGWSMLARCLHDEPAAIQQRFCLKTPPTVAAADGSWGDAGAAWTRLQPVLAEALNPEEARCFA